jgi:hypothetical protein
MIAEKDIRPGAWFLSVATICVGVHYGRTDATSFALSQRLVPTSTFAPMTEPPRPTLTVQQMAIALRDSGLPISAIAETVRVERKTIYSWINGASEVRGPNFVRMSQVYRLLTAFPDLDARQIYRFWNSPADGQRTLRDLIAANFLDEEAIRRAISGIRPSALRAAKSEQTMARRGANPVIDEIPDVGDGR